MIYNHKTSRRVPIIGKHTKAHSSPWAPSLNLIISTTYWLIEMLKVNRHSHQVSEARAFIAQVHLEMSQKARDTGDWDAAQEHLDAALEVRLPNSYLP